eukprot:COSAG01_NODE_8054_length_2918_cov_9.946089_4_plen_329_part_00
MCIAGPLTTSSCPLSLLVLLVLVLGLRLSRSSAKSTDLLQAAQFYCHVGEFDTARELVDVILDREPQNTVAVALGGWVDLLCGREAKANKSIRAFEAAEKSPDQGAVLSSLLGKARYWQRKRARSAGEKQENFQQSLDCLVNAWAQFQWCLPALLEQVQVYMMMGKWSEALDIAHRVQGQDDKNIEAARFVVVHTLARESKYGEAQNQLQGLTQLMSRCAHGCLATPPSPPPSAGTFYLSHAQTDTARCVARWVARGGAVSRAVLRGGGAAGTSPRTRRCSIGAGSRSRGWRGGTRGCSRSRCAWPRWRATSRPRPRPTRPRWASSCS